MSAPAIQIVIPTVGRPALARTIAALGGSDREDIGLTLIDDRAHARTPLPGIGAAGALFPGRLRVLRGRAAGPAAARNLGWHATESPWIAFLDDDVVPEVRWTTALRADIAALAPDDAGTQGRLVVPLPTWRAPTDHERHVAGLAAAHWATADMAFRRAALSDAGGFDERFPRAYREDADLALRLSRRGWRLVRGRRRTVHPVGDAGPWHSVHAQAGNADDVLMWALHGRGWRERAGAPRGRARRHLTVTAAGGVAAVLAIAGRRRGASLAAAAWLAGTAEFTAARIAPGPRTAREVATMVATSAAIPAAATVHRLRGLLRLRRSVANRLAAPGRPHGPRPRAVLLDRDGTLIHDEPYNGDPGLVRVMPGVRAAVQRLRAADVATAVVSNQSGIGRGLLDADQVGRVNGRVEELLGPLGPWLVCPHAPDDACGCRKPQPGLVLAAARHLGVRPDECAVIGDIWADVEAARRAGARAVLVPTPRTRRAEVEAAPEVAPDVAAAVELLLGTGT